MEQEIYLGGQPIGTATVQREGLYCRFHCRCRLSGDVVYRLRVCIGDRWENLGIPVPDNGWFVLETRIPAKKLGPGQFRIEAVPKGVDLNGKFVPLRPEEPFRYLKRLEQAYLQVRQGEVGVVIRQQP